MEGGTLPLKTSEVLEVAVKIPPAELAHRGEALEVELQLQLLLEVHVVSGAMVLGSECLDTMTQPVSAAQLSAPTHLGHLSHSIVEGSCEFSQ